MFKFLHFFSLFIIHTTLSTWSNWNLTCFENTSRLRGQPYATGPYFKYCAIEFFPTSHGYEFIALGYEVKTGTNDELIDEFFNDTTIAVSLDKKKDPGEPESIFYVCRTPMCNFGKTPQLFLEFQELLLVGKHNKPFLFWEMGSNNRSVFQNNQMVKEIESNEGYIIAD